ncbi:MAG: hypothetical protein R3C68_08780 [Myxococcota bacterium]
MFGWCVLALSLGNFPAAQLQIVDLRPEHSQSLDSLQQALHQPPDLVVHSTILRPPPATDPDILGRAKQLLETAEADAIELRFEPVLEHLAQVQAYYRTIWTAQRQQHSSPMGCGCAG